MADPDPSQAKVLIDEKEQHDVKGVSSGVEPASTGPDSAGPTPTSAASTASTHFSPPTSLPDSPPDARKHSTIDEYYSSRPKHDKLGNPIPERRRPQGAMSSVYGTAKVRLPGDLGANDPRRARSPAPNTLPGDLGPNDPRRPSSRTVSPAPSGHSRQGSDGFDSPDGGGRRILKDPKPPPESEPADSDQDGDADSDTDNDNDEGARGRQKKRPEPGRTTAGKSVNVRGDSADSEVVFPQFQGDKKPDPTKGESAISFKLNPPSEREKLKKRVHPMSAFDSAPSGYSTPLGSDDESHSEMLAAQKLSLTMSAVHSTPSAHRVIRQIIRGDYPHFQREAEEGRKRQRMYLVATDISPEAEYALEWTIGTVLRDGDTLFAVYAADEEAANEGGVEIGHGAENVKDTAKIIRDLPAVTNAAPQSAGPSPLAQSAVPGEAPGKYSSAEAERRHAVEDITDRCVRLLRKTRLQVRVVVEVFHCKSPRHMITELIDFLSPTLVIIGSRGRSAVKGVLLGSFSNYLVTKSSVPVMVARKKLRKHSKMVRNRDGTAVPYSGITGRAGRLSNVIEAPKGKGLRVQGWDKVGID